MALTWTYTPSQDSTWGQSGPLSGRHSTTVKATGFIATDYYAMVAELYADPGLPAWNTTPDPAIFNMRLSEWEIQDIQCGSPTPGITLRLEYVQQSFGSLEEPDADGAVVYRQRSLPAEFQYVRDVSDGLLSVTRDGDTQNKFWIGQKSLMVHECQRTEPGLPNPAIRALPILDTVNLTTWNGRAPRTVQFVDFSSETRDNESTYQCVYSFIENTQTFDPLLYWTLPNGLVPDDAPSLPNPGTALIQPKVIPDSEFSVLNITIP